MSTPANSPFHGARLVSAVAIVRVSSTRDEASESRELLTSPVGRPAQAGDEEFENFRCQNKVSVLAKAGCCARMTARSADKRRTLVGRRRHRPIHERRADIEQRSFFCANLLKSTHLVSRWVYPRTTSL